MLRRPMKKKLSLYAFVATMAAVPLLSGCSDVKDALGEQSARVHRGQLPQLVGLQELVDRGQQPEGPGRVATRTHDDECPPSAATIQSAP